MKGITIYLSTSFKPVKFDKVEDYKIKRGFLCLKLIDGKSICYNLDKIDRFEVEEKEW